AFRHSSPRAATDRQMSKISRVDVRRVGTPHLLGLRREIRMARQESSRYSDGLPPVPCPGGGGMVISIGVTGPSVLSGLSNSAALPTTSTRICCLCRYRGGTFATSVSLTFSIPDR